MDSLTHKTSKVGLALSGGAARGLAHIGVLKALEEEAIPIDMIAGVSAGAMIGACYAKERNAVILEEIALGIDWKKLARLFDLNLISLGKGFVQGQRVKALLGSIIGNTKFEDLGIPLAVVAADVQSMEEIIINKGPVIEAVRASISMPVILTPVKWRNRFLIDGGVVNPMPVDVVRSMGAEIVIAVNVLAIAQRREREEPIRKEAKVEPSLHSKNARLSAIRKRIDNLLRENKDKIRLLDELSNIARTRIYAGRGKIDPKTPSIFDVLMQTIHAMEYEKTRLATKTADIVISPDVSHIGTFGFYKGEEAISQGYKATKDILPRLQEMIRSIPSSPL